MTCKYCDTILTNLKARVCKSRLCKNAGKRERQQLRLKLRPKVVISPIQPSLGDDGPEELQYLDDDPGITLKELLDVHRDLKIRYKAQSSQQIRQQKLVRRIQDAGLYDVNV